MSILMLFIISIMSLGILDKIGWDWIFDWKLLVSQKINPKLLPQ